MIKEWWRKLCPSHKVEGQEQPAADKLRAVRAACFVAMHYPEAVSALLRQYGVDFCVTQEEQRIYLQGGVTPETVYRTIRVHYELILDSLKRIRGIAFREARHRGRAERCTEAMLQHLQQCTAGWTDRVESVPYMWALVRRTMIRLAVRTALSVWILFVIVLVF